MHAVAYDDIRAEVRRELMLRRRVYRNWVKAGTMTEADAQRHIARLMACAEVLDEAAAIGPATLTRIRQIDTEE
jgi:hypothetical protein